VLVLPENCIRPLTPVSTWSAGPSPTAATGRASDIVSIPSGSFQQKKRERQMGAHAG